MYGEYKIVSACGAATALNGEFPENISLYFINIMYP